MEKFGHAYNISLTSKEQIYARPHLEFVTQEKIDLKKEKLEFGKHFLAVLKITDESDLYSVSKAIHSDNLKIFKRISFETADNKGSNA